MGARRFGWAKTIAALAAAGGCAGGSASAPGYVDLLPVGQRSAAQERIFSVHWFSRADERVGLPYRPVEPGEPAVDPRSRQVVVATGDGKVHALDGEGRPLWERELGSPFDAGPTLAEGRVFAGTAKGELCALEAASGRVLWCYRAAEELVTRPVVAGGLVFVQSSADTLYAIDAAKGEWRWQYRRDVPSDFTNRGAARPAVAGGKVWAGFADGTLAALDAKDGAVLWTKDLGGGKPISDVDAGPLLDGEGRLFAAAYSVGVFALEAESGKLLWSAPRPNVSALALEPNGGRLFAGGEGFLAALATGTGEARWNLPLPNDRFVSGLAVANGLVLASTGQGPLLFVDGVTGQLRRQFDPGHGVWAAPRVEGGLAYVLSNRGVVYALGIEARGGP